MSQLPYSGFSSQQLAESSEYSDSEVEENWIETMAAFCQVEAIRDEQLKYQLQAIANSQQHIGGSFDSYLMGQMMLIHTHASAQQFNRTATHAATDGLDAVGVICWQQGGMINQGQQTIGAKQGDIHLIDFTQDSLLHTTDFETVGLLIPRYLLEAAHIAPEQLHLAQLNGQQASTRILHRHISSLYEEAGGLDVETAAAMTEPTVALLKACLSGDPESMEQATPVVERNLLLEIRQLIDQQLLNPALNVDFIAQQFNLSRAQLYRLAEPLGGIQKFIQQRRLKRAFQQLVSPTGMQTNLAQMAYQLGFPSEDTFRRQFKAAFGMTPSEVRGNRHAAYEQIKQQRSSDKGGVEATGEALHQQWVHDLFS